MVQTSASFRHELQDGDGSISLSEIISALSFALDLTEGAVLGHALRSCLLGMRIAAEAKLPSDQSGNLYFALLLKDIGCGSAEMVSLRHERGASILGKLGMGREASQAVRSLTEHWDGDGYPDSLRGEQIPLLARICAVAQHLDVVSSDGGVEKAIETLEQRSGTWFDPEMVRVAVSLHRRGALWANCAVSDSEEGTRQAVLDFDAGRRHRLGSHQIDQICEAFADVVDAKSHFTFRHSVGVAESAFGIAKALGLPADRVQLVRRAALLHDIGKLSVSNTILNKTSNLSTEEWKVVRQHPTMTRRILDRIAPFREMAVIAAEHHEKLDGSGYPNRLIAPDLSLESRIIAVADVYGALSEERPYRAALQFDEIVPIMARLVPNKLDRRCFDALVGIISSRNASTLAMPITQANPIYAFA